MTVNSKTWLYLSVFYNKGMWNNLFSEAISPVLKQLVNNKLADKYIISFNTEQGDNIRLTVLLNDSIKEKVLEQCHQSLTNYLQAYPSENIEQVYPLKEFLMPFPNNSIQYNLFDNLTTTPEKLIQFQTIVSSLILDTFSKTEVDEASIFSFILYSTISILHTATKVLDNFDPDILDDSLRKHFGSRDKSSEDYFAYYHLLFTENKEVILEIYQEVGHEEKKGSALINISMLKHSCIDFLKTSNKETNESNIILLCQTMLQQLNVDFEILPGICHIIKECIMHLGENNSNDGGFMINPMT